MSSLQLVCPKCKSINIHVEMINKRKRLGFFRLAIYLTLLIVNFIIWLIALLIPRGHKHLKTAICNNCGHSWKLR